MCVLGTGVLYTWEGTDCSLLYYNARAASPTLPTVRGGGQHIVLDVPALKLDGRLSASVVTVVCAICPVPGMGVRRVPGPEQQLSPGPTHMYMACTYVRARARVYMCVCLSM